MPVKCQTISIVNVRFLQTKTLIRILNLHIELNIILATWLIILKG